MSSSGCLLPLLVIGNLFLGRLFMPLRPWICVELILIALFLLHSFLLTRRIAELARTRRNIIDVEGEVLKDDKKKLSGQ